MQLKELITDMQKHGTTVCFVDIPLDPLIYEGKMEAGSRKIIEEIFPRTQYKWISPSDKKTWNTTDGLHLTPEEARAFYKDMNQQLAQILGAQTPPM